MGANQQQLLSAGFNPQNVSGLQAWYQVNASTNSASVPDLSVAQGGGTLTAAATAPVRTTNGSVNVLRWDGSASKPLLGTPETVWTHLFMVASYTDATTDAVYRGLVGAQSVNLLISDGGNAGVGTTFFDLSAGLTYSLNGTGYASANMQIPINNTLGVIQYSGAGPYTMTGGIEIGLQQAIAGRIWKGDVALMLLYNNGAMTSAQATQIRKWCGAVCGGISTT